MMEEMKEITHANCHFWSATDCTQDVDSDRRLTAEIEMVARAKGSPMMLPVSTPRRPYCLEFSILRKDGE